MNTLRPKIEKHIVRGSLVASTRFCIRNVSYMVELVGLEPTMPEAEDLQSPGVTNFPTTPKFVKEYTALFGCYAIHNFCPCCSLSADNTFPYPTWTDFAYRSSLS
jgi:hypothetical protein